MVVELEKMYDQHANDLIKVVSYADPPGPCEGTIFTMSTTPEGWVSNILNQLRRNVSFEGKGTGAKIIDAAFCEVNGPAVVIQIPLKRAISIAWKRDYWNGERSIEGLNINLGALCAYIEYETTGRAAIVCSVPCELLRKVNVKEFSLMNDRGGCSTTSECFYPGTNGFQRLVRAKRRSALGREGVKAHLKRVAFTEKRVQTLFPNQDFSCNKIIAQLMRTELCRHQLQLL